MKHITGKYRFAQKQSGVTLFVALIMLLVLTIIGLAASQRSSLQERMAANMHLDNMTFSASESALGAFMAEANQGNKLTPGHILSDLRLGVAVVNKQYDKDGQRVLAGKLDSNLGGGSLVASIDPSVINQCDKACGGFSFGGDVGCRYYKLDATGQLKKNGQDIKSATTTLWVKEITTCN